VTSIRNNPDLGRGMLGCTEDYAHTQRAGYLNAAAIGLIAEPVLSTYETFSRNLARRGATAYFDDVERITKGPRRAGERLFGAPAGSVAAVTSISEVICQIAWWLRPRAGQNVVCVDTEPGAVTLPWVRVAEETGAEVRMVPLRNKLESESHDRIAALVDRNTVAISISHVQWITGYRYDLKLLADLAHSHGALLIVDAMQSAGVVPIDVRASGVDVLVAGSYKWLCSFAGIAACYLRPELTERFNPVLVGARSTDPAPPFDNVDARFLHLPDDARRLEYASTAHGSRVALGAAVDYLLTIGIDRIFAHTQRLSAVLREGLLRLGAHVVTPANPDRHAAILSARFAGGAAVDLAAELATHGVQVSPRHGLIRFALHFFNDDADVEHALTILSRVLPGRIAK
jgi:cysteine desulfurase / selenocysteine lyase